MKILQNKAMWLTTALMLLMAMTRYNHFGSSVALPDASYAVFFLGGLFLGRVREGLAVLALLLLEAAVVDYYAINFRDVSAWCVTSAYGFLVFSYASLWFVGNWYAPRHSLTGQGLFGLLAAAVAAGSFAFVIANVSFYLLAGYFGSMGVAEYISRVAQYYGSYVAVTVLYVGCAVILRMAYAALAGKGQPPKLLEFVGVATSGVEQVRFPLDQAAFHTSHHFFEFDIAANSAVASASHAATQKPASCSATL